MRAALGDFDPDTYPGWRPPGPVLVHEGRMTPLDAGSLPDVERVPTLRARAVRWSLAHGSNACPDRLVDKGLDARGAVLVPAVVSGWAPAFEARRVPSHGAVPVTLVPTPGDHEVWLLGVHAEDIASLDASEGRGERYLVGQVGPVTIPGGGRRARVPAYGPTGRTQVLLDGASPALWPARDQAWAAARFEADGPTMPVDPLPGVVDQGWPASGRADLGTVL